VLERGVAAYPYYGQLTARLAQLYAMDGQTGKARNLVKQYLAVFPEDLALREAEKRLDGAESVDPLAAPGHTAVAQEPR